MNTERPCIIVGENTHAKFHKFFTQAYIVAPSVMVGGHSGGQVSNELALIELPDGSVISVPATNIQFTDVKE